MGGFWSAAHAPANSKYLDHIIDYFDDKTDAPG
jgi:hypothetical protein